MGRWSDYVVAFGGDGDDSEHLWVEASNSIADSRSMFLLGVGFDPRALAGLKRFLNLDLPNPPVVGLIEHPPASSASGHSARELADFNRAEFKKLTNGIQTRIVPHEHVHSASFAGPRVSRAITTKGFLDGIGHLVVDVSSLPSIIYFPVIAAALQLLDKGISGTLGEIQIVACENPAIDAAILEQEIHGANWVGGFREELVLERPASETIIWAPIVGENSGPAMTAIHEFLDPADVYPVLPFPSVDPRRADTLLLEHRIELMDQFQVNPGNIIFADERNPFDLYRTLSELHSELRFTFEQLGQTKLAVSTHSSKLLSVGVLLAAYEQALPVVAAPPIDYEIEAIDTRASVEESQLACAWLAGLPYA